MRASTCPVILRNRVVMAGVPPCVNMQATTMLLAVLLLAASCSHAGAAGTVFVVPFFARNSPSLDVMAVAGELQQRGYDLITATPEIDIKFLSTAAARHQHPPSAAEDNPPSMGRLDFLTFDLTGVRFFDVVTPSLKSASTEGMNPLKLAPKVVRSFSDACKDLVLNATAMQAIRDARPDVLLSYATPFGSDSCVCVLSHALGVPYVLADGNPMVKGPLSVPQFSSGLTPEGLKTPVGYLKNLAVYGIVRLMTEVMPRFAADWKAVREAAGVKAAQEYGGCQPAVHLHLQGFVLEYPRPLPPGHVMLGPSSPRLAHSTAHQQQYQPEVWSFVEGADPDAGVALVGMGSAGLFGQAFRPEDWKALAAAFTDLAPTRVIWPLMPSNLPESARLEDLHLGSNVLVVPWVDYNDVLGHPNTKLFISHCGPHSVYEAAFHGVPIVGIPFILDQQESAARAEAKGLGLVCQEAVAFRSKSNQVTFKRDTLAALAKKVLTTPSFKATAASISAKLQTYYRFRTPVQRAADEVEVLLAGTHPASHVLGNSSSQLPSQKEASLEGAQEL